MKNFITKLKQIISGLTYLSDYSNKIYNASSGNFNFEFSTNGESLLLQQLKPSVIWDIGANKGQYAEEVLHIVTSARIVCVEPFAKTYKELSKLSGCNKNILTINCALSDYDGKIKATTSGDTTGNKIKNFGGEIEEIEVKSISKFMGDIPKDFMNPDLIKIDTEGSEYSILCEIIDNLSNLSNLKYIQFEYGDTWLDFNQSLYNLINRLNDKKVQYKIGKLTKRGIRWFDYDRRRHDDFRMSNMVLLLNSNM